jgi:hypothetical protein
MENYYNNLERINQKYNQIGRSLRVFDAIFLSNTAKLLILKATDAIRMITHRHLYSIVPEDKSILIINN